MGYLVSAILCFIVAIACAVWAWLEENKQQSPDHVFLITGVSRRQEESEKILRKSLDMRL